MDDDARQGGPRPRRKERVPPRVLTFRGQADPRRDASAPECACKPEAQFRLQNKPNPTDQLEPVMRRSQHRGRRGPRTGRYQSITSICHECHLIPLCMSWLGGHLTARWWWWHYCAWGTEVTT